MTGSMVDETMRVERWPATRHGRFVASVSRHGRVPVMPATRRVSLVIVRVGWSVPLAVSATVAMHFVLTAVGTGRPLRGLLLAAVYLCSLMLVAADLVTANRNK